VDEKPEVVVYTKPFCAYCVAAKSLLREKGVGYREVDISRDEGERHNMMHRTGQRSVPQIFIGAEHVGGFEELVTLDQQGRLDPLLGISG